MLAGRRCGPALPPTICSSLGKFLNSQNLGFLIHEVVNDNGTSLMGLHED